MTDPWADVRERLDRAEEVESSDVEVSGGTRQYTADVRTVLIDADALLAVVRAARKAHESLGNTPEPGRRHYDQDEVDAAVQDCYDGLDEAIVALPEHLRTGESDDE